MDRYVVPGWTNRNRDDYISTWMDILVPKWMSMYLAGYMEIKVNAVVSE